MKQCIVHINKLQLNVNRNHAADQHWLLLLPLGSSLFSTALGVTSRSVRERELAAPSFSVFFFFFLFLADCSLREQDTTAGLEYSVYRFIHGDRQAQWWAIKGARNSIMPNEESFSKTRWVQFCSIKGNLHIEVMVTVNINTLTIQFWFNFTCPQPCEPAELYKTLSVLTPWCGRTFPYDEQTMQAIIIQDDSS